MCQAVRCLPLKGSCFFLAIQIIDKNQSYKEFHYYLSMLR